MWPHPLRTSQQQPSRASHPPSPICRHERSQLLTPPAPPLHAEEQRPAAFRKRVRQQREALAAQGAQELPVEAALSAEQGLISLPNSKLLQQRTQPSGSGSSSREDTGPDSAAAKVLKGQVVDSFYAVRAAVAGAGALCPTALLHVPAMSAIFF